MAYTEEQVIAALKKHKGMVYKAAKELKCSPVTIYNWRDNSEAVRETIIYQCGELLDEAESKLWAAVKAGEQWAIKLVLKTVGRERGYVEKVEFDFNARLANEMVQALRAAGVDVDAFFERARAEAERRAVLKLSASSESEKA